MHAMLIQALWLCVLQHNTLWASISAPECVSVPVCRLYGLRVLTACLLTAPALICGAGERVALVSFRG
jgi:hypothetical protein